MDPKPLLKHIFEAQRIASENGIPNILQPGLVKELILGAMLGHDVIITKANADACDASGNMYEYLCSLTSSNNFQMDRVTNNNLDRITRNRMVFCAFFSDALTVHEIYEVEPTVVLAEVIRQLEKSKNEISHVNLTGAWVKKNGKKVDLQVQTQPPPAP